MDIWSKVTLATMYWIGLLGILSQKNTTMSKWGIAFLQMGKSISPNGEMNIYV